MTKRRAPQRSQKFYQAMPKVELHRHLEGSVRLSTLVDVARAYGLTIPNTGQLRSLVQVNEEDPYTFKNFLSKFQTLRLFYRSPDIIGRITREAIVDAAADNVRYLELRFTPVALGREQGFSLKEVVEWVIAAAQQAEQVTGTIVRLIMSINRHESLELAEEVMRLACDYRQRGVVALDLAGDESSSPATPFIPLFREAKQAGLHVVIHAGEWNGPENVVEAIEAFGAERIGHGVRVMEDPAAIALARERQPVFEVCVTSNYQSGVVTPSQPHPLTDMLAAGLNVTINTDDPSISQITLSDEYRRVCDEQGLSLDQLEERVLAAARAAFLSEAERQELIESLSQEIGVAG